MNNSEKLQQDVRRHQREREKSNRFYEQNGNLKHVHDALFVHFFTVTSRLRGGIPSSDVLLRTLTQDYKFLFLPLNFVAVSKNSILGKFTYFWDFSPVGKIATKFEKKAKSIK